jgi:hypothetical protein
MVYYYKYYVFGHYPPSCSIYWIQLSRFYLRTETESGLRNAVFFKKWTRRWIMSKNIILVYFSFRNLLLSSNFIYSYIILMGRGREDIKYSYLLIFILYFILLRIYFRCRSQWPRGLRHELSSLARTLELWVRMPLMVMMSVCAFILCLCCPVCR